MVQNEVKFDLVKAMYLFYKLRYRKNIFLARHVQMSKQENIPVVSYKPYKAQNIDTGTRVSN